MSLHSSSSGGRKVLRANTPATATTTGRNNTTTVSQTRPPSRDMINTYTSDAMIEAKLHRKRTEGDLQLLMNRIELLKTEEQKAVQKINETKARAQEIRQIKKRNEDTMQEQFSVTLGREIAVKAMNERAVTERQTLRKKLNDSKKKVEDDNKRNASKLKDQRRCLEEIAQNFRLQTEMEKRKKADEVKRRCVVVGCGVVLVFLIVFFVFG